MLTEMGRFDNAADALFALEQRGLGPFGVPRPVPPMSPGSAAMWDRLKKAVHVEQARQASGPWGFRSQTVREGNFELTTIVGTVGEQLSQTESLARHTPTLPGEHATHGIGMQIGENLPEGIVSAPAAALNLSALKTVENATRKVMEAGGIVETKTTLMIEQRIVNGQPVRVMVGVIREAWVSDVSGFGRSPAFVDFEAVVDPVTRQVTIIRNRSA